MGNLDEIVRHALTLRRDTKELSVMVGNRNDMTTTLYDVQDYYFQTNSDGSEYLVLEIESDDDDNEDND